MPLRLFCRLAFVAASLVLLAAGGAMGTPEVVPPTVTVLRSAWPRSQRLRVNDTLVLEVSRPYGTFTTYDHPAPIWLWQRAELRGRYGYRQQLADGSDDLCTLLSLTQVYRPFQPSLRASALGRALAGSGLAKTGLGQHVAAYQ